MHFNPTFVRRSAGLILFAFVAAGCRREEITTYSVPKEKTVSAASAAPAVEAGAPEKPLWKVPADWQQLPSTEMRLGNFLAQGADGKKAEITVLSFPGNVGSELDNVNRWRNQLGLPPVTQESLGAENFNIDGAAAKIYDFTSGPKRLIVAALPRNGVTWFFKMLGDEPVVGAQRSAFVEFLKSVSFAQSHPADAIPAAPVSTNVKKVPEPAGDKPAWDAPADWNAVMPTAMIHSKFVIAGEQNSKAEVTVSVFPGDAGGPLANVNRWRNQLGLAPVDAMEKLVSSVDVIGGKAMLVDMSGDDARTGQKARLIAAIVSRNGRTWFYKLMGDEGVVAKQKDAFVKFVQTVRYPNA